jgi:hypothetical protein
MAFKRKRCPRYRIAARRVRWRSERSLGASTQRYVFQAQICTGFGRCGRPNHDASSHWRWYQTHFRSDGPVTMRHPAGGGTIRIFGRTDANCRVRLRRPLKMPLTKKRKKGHDGFAYLMHVLPQPCPCMRLAGSRSCWTSPSMTSSVTKSILDVSFQRRRSVSA